MKNENTAWRRLDPAAGQFYLYPSGRANPPGEPLSRLHRYAKHCGQVIRRLGRDASPYLLQFLSIELTIGLIAIALFLGLFTSTALAVLPSTNVAPRVEKMTAGTVELIITADPPQVHLDRDILLSIKTIAPSNINVRLPPLDNRLTGFTLSGAFDREPMAVDGAIARDHCFRLTPLVAAEYRLAPMAVTYTDTSRPNAPENWFATRAFNFEVVPVGSEHPGASIRDIRGPVWIYPAFKTVAGWTAILALMAAAIWALYRLSRRIHRAVQLRRMSPRERALVELADLMARDLIAKNQVKEFFLELTLIVRRYIERAHTIRAPEQTTEEFLLAAACNQQFRPEVLGKLRVFLQTADLVKFAAYRPESAVVDRAFGTARDYIETDEWMTENEENAQHPTSNAQRRMEETQAKLKQGLSADAQGRKTDAAKTR